MISMSVVEKLETLVPAGQRSDFINEALEENLAQYARRKAFEELDEFKKKHPLKMSTGQILKIIHDGRKELL